MFRSEESVPATGAVRKLGFGRALCAAGLTLVATAGAASAQQIAGDWDLVNGDPAYNVPPDPSATWSDATGSGQLWSRPSSEGVGFTASSLSFDPATFVPFDNLSLGADYDKLSGNFEGGSPRWVFLLDKNNNGVVDMDDRQNLTGDARAILFWHGGPIGTGDNDPGAVTFDEFLTSDITSPWFEPLQGFTNEELGGSNPYRNYSEVMALVGDLDVLRIDLAFDSGWAGGGTTQGVELSNIQVAAIPEPTALGLLGLGSLALLRRRRANA